MKKSDLKKIADFVNEKAKEQLSAHPKEKEIILAKKNLKKYSTNQEKEFTFTVGEINAYMG